MEKPLQKKKLKPERETKDIFINGFIYTLVKGRTDSCYGVSPPCYMGQQGWALQGVMRCKRKCLTRIKRTK